MVRPRCANIGLRDDVPEESFWAHCLGTVQRYDRITGPW
jgi:hypothetical protein